MTQRNTSAHENKYHVIQLDALGVNVRLPHSIYSEVDFRYDHDVNDYFTYQKQMRRELQFPQTFGSRFQEYLESILRVSGILQEDHNGQYFSHSSGSVLRARVSYRSGLEGHFQRYVQGHEEGHFLDQIIPAPLFPQAVNEIGKYNGITFEVWDWSHEEARADALGLIALKRNFDMEDSDKTERISAFRKCVRAWIGERFAEYYSQVPEVEIYPQHPDRYEPKDPFVLTLKDATGKTKQTAA